MTSWRAFTKACVRPAKCMGSLIFIANEFSFLDPLNRVGCKCIEKMGTFCMHLHTLKPSQRFYLPVKPCLTLANIGGSDSFAELGTRFKASHIKVMLWWLALETTEFADQNPEVPCSVLLCGLKNSFVMFHVSTRYFL